jgi:hypothetical protein
MHRLLHRLILIVVLALLGIATGVTTAQSSAARITAFTTTLASVDRAALSNRTARVPVSWATQNRPVFANLFFEQVMPDGGVINVELPRVIPWVNSNGDGMAAPILPSDSATEITLRVRLMSLLNGQLLDERILRLPIGNGGGQSADPSSRPIITSFSACCATVNANALNTRSAYIPVTWSAANRPITANLIFEQVLADGSVVNVELPRSNPWVNSSGQGVTAPVAPGGGSRDVNLRLRLIDLLTGRVYDQRTVRLTVTDDSPQPGRIVYFTSPQTGVSASDLAMRNAFVPVSWSVDNRPEGSNLFFEQVFPDGQVVNIELPRQNPYVSSQGSGTVQPRWVSGPDHVTLRLRLARLSDNATIDQMQFAIRIYGDTPATLTPGPTPTHTPTPGPNPVTEIFQFNASANTVFPGQTITLNWDVRHASFVNVRAAITSPNTSDAAASNLPLVGSTTLTIPASVPTNVTGKLVLEVFTESHIPAMTRELPLTVACRHDFIFGNMDDCRTADATGADSAYQTFEGGIMVWRSDTRQVYGLHHSGAAFLETEMYSEGGSLWEGDIPPGLLRPERGFGDVWSRVQPIRDNFGWATSAERGFAGTFQRGQNGNMEITYFNTPDGRIVRFVREGTAYHWSYV